MANYWLQIKRGAQLVSNTRLSGERVVLGRAPDCDIVLNGDGVSRQHAELVAGGDGWLVRDRGSRNGLIVNGARLVGEHAIQPGDRVQLDIFDLTLKKEAPLAPRARPVVAVGDGNYGLVRTMHEMAPPKLEAKHLANLLAFSSTLLAAEAASGRQRLLCELMVGKEFHGTAAMLLRLHRDDATLTPEPLGEPVLTGGGEAPHISRSVLQAVLASETAVLAASRPTPAGGATDVVKMSVAASAGSRVAAVACPLVVTPEHLDLLYVMLPGTYGTAEWLALATMATSMSRQAEEVWAARQAAQQQALLEEELRRAHDLQMRLVPADFVAGRVDIAFGFVPCKGVGGDYVDAVTMADGRVLLVAMDVAGKGMDAAIIAGGLHTTVHVCAAHGFALTEMIRTLNRYLMATWETSVTVAASILDPRTGVIESINCNHPNPIVVGPGGQTRELQALETIPLGFTDFEIETCSDRLAPGELLAYYSDGLTELFDESDAMLGPEGVTQHLSELRAALGPRPQTPTPHLVMQLHQRLADFRGKASPSDDVSFILALART